MWQASNALGGQVLARVRLDTAFLSLVEQRSGLHHHQVGRLDLRPALRKRVLDALVHADRAVEYDPLLRIFRRPLYCHPAESDRLRAEQHTLRVEAVDDDLEALTFPADTVFLGDEQVVDEQHVRIDCVAAHLVYQARFDLGAIEVVKNSDSPSVFRLTSSSGVVRAISSILFATCAMEIQIFSPLTYSRRRAFPRAS